MLPQSRLGRAPSGRAPDKALLRGPQPSGSLRHAPSAPMFGRNKFSFRFSAQDKHWAAIPSSAQAVTVDFSAAPPKRSYSKDGLDVVKSDDNLHGHEAHLEYRYRQFLRTKASIEDNEGSLEEFAKGYQKLGIIREGGKTVYREWAPGAVAAQIIGDFNGWHGTWMERDEWGVFSVTLPDDPSGRPAIPHGSRVKIRLQHSGGWWVDRLPAWIKWATVEPNKMGAKYDGIHWDPPANERYQFKHPRPGRAASLRIYEAHVGMSSDEAMVASYTHFKDNVLPRIKALGYNAIQLMAIQEHAYYGSFGYHVTNPFAVSSRSGNPEELKALIDEAHRLGIAVLLDIVHSHISSNVDDGLAGFDLGQPDEANYFLSGERGYHTQWDSRLLNYSGYEVLRYLLSNVRYWLEEFKFDGFRFDGVTSMLYHHHGINVGFTGQYGEYFSPATNVDAVVYLMLANDLVHQLVPEAITIAEDVSGMPALCRPVEEGGVGFDYRLGMGLPDYWIKLLKHSTDEEWRMSDLVGTLCNRRYTERTVAYAESHDQALVGDKTVAFRLMDAEMYDGMSNLSPPSPVIERGVALHKMIRTVTMALGGEAYLNFMGNEFGHPEWIDFPRDGNNWSYHHCRRQWGLVDNGTLRYRDLNAWDAACLALDNAHPFISSQWQWATMIDDERQVLVAERGPLVFVFNFSPHNDYEGLKIPVPEPGRYRVILDSDEPVYGGRGRVGHDVDHFTQPVGSGGEAGEGELGGNFHSRGQYMYVMAPARTVVAYKKQEEGAPQQAAAPPPPAVAMPKQ